MPDTAVVECPVCLRHGCRKHAAAIRPRKHAAAVRPSCTCERPILMGAAGGADEELVCLKCGRARPGAYRG